MSDEKSPIKTQAVQKLGHVASVVSEPRPLDDAQYPDQDHRSSHNFDFRIAEGDGWLFEIEEPTQQQTEFKLWKDDDWNDTHIFDDLRHGMYKATKHIGPERNVFYIADPAHATARFTVRVFGARLV